MQRQHLIDSKRALISGRHLFAANDPLTRTPVEQRLDIPAPEFTCPECGTRYFEPQPCDWCPGHTAVADPYSTPAN